MNNGDATEVKLSWNYPGKLPLQQESWWFYAADLISLLPQDIENMIIDIGEWQIQM